MYERHCIGILAHKSRVAAARHTRLTRSTGPTSVQVQTQMRATHFARVLSHLAHRAQLANADTRICTSRHSSTALHLDFAGTHLEALARQTPFAGWHADESRRQSPLTHCALQNYSTPAGCSPRPPFVTARASSLQLLHRLESCTRLRSCCREAIRLVVLASPSKFGTAAALWPSRRVSSKLRPREEVLDLIAGRSNDERRGPLPPSCRCSRGSVCKVSLFIYSALDRASAVALLARLQLSDACSTVLLHVVVMCAS